MKRIIALCLALTVSVGGYFTQVFAATPDADTNVDKNRSDLVFKLNGAVLDAEKYSFDIDVATAGTYNLGMSYKSLNESKKDIYIGLMIDGKYPFDGADGIYFPRMWCDKEKKRRTDDRGNEYTSSQTVFADYCYNYAYDTDSLKYERLEFDVSAGKHTVTVLPVSGTPQVEYVSLSLKKDIPDYRKPSPQKYYSGKDIVLEGENADIKSNYFLVGQTDSSSVDITPTCADHTVVNYIGGSNWKTVGDTIIWETPELESGYYAIDFSFRQNQIIGGKSYRTLLIDGELPFAEAAEVGFGYKDFWQQQRFSDGNEPYLVWLPAGKHTIALQVNVGPIADVCEMLTTAIGKMSNLYVDITMITGDSIDVYRDYDLFRQLPDMQNELESILDLLNDSAKKIQDITGEKSGSNYSVLKQMCEIIEQMLSNKLDAHRYIGSFYSNYCSVSSVADELRSMPLDIDKLILCSPESELHKTKISFFYKLMYSFKRFGLSFVSDYKVEDKDNSNSVTVWVTWGRDQVQVLDSLIDRSFIPKTGINVNLKLVNTSVVQAKLSGKGPDVILQQARSQPVNFAMRGLLYDLSQFKDTDSILKRFAKGAETPYRYKDGLYALPDTQTFFMMFYRKDILDKIDVHSLETWDDFKRAAKIIMRNNMAVSLPNVAATDEAQVNAGVGCNNIFPSLLLQNNIDLYSAGGKKTNLRQSDVMQIFEQWTSYYRKLQFPLAMDFYTRFRTGTCPLGIGTYTLYTTLKTSAHEIDGLWGMTAVPGTVRADGTVSHASAGGGTGCCILKDSKNPKLAWEFLKWWTDTDTQYAFSSDVESILGPVGRSTSSNIETIKSFNWDGDMLDELLKAWDEVYEIPEYPGSYYVSRSIYQSFWNVINDNQNTKDMLMKYGTEADEEIARKWKQYKNR